MIRSCSQPRSNACALTGRSSWVTRLGGFCWAGGISPKQNVAYGISATTTCGFKTRGSGQRGRLVTEEIWPWPPESLGKNTSDFTILDAGGNASARSQRHHSSSPLHSGVRALFIVRLPVRTTYRTVPTCRPLLLGCSLAIIDARNEPNFQYQLDQSRIAHGK